MTDEKTAYDIPSDEIDVAEKIIKNDQYKRLSNEAKDVIKLILDSPSEILSLLPKSRSRSPKLTKKKINLYLILKWRNANFSKLITKNLADEVINEITRWVKSL